MRHNALLRLGPIVAALALAATAPGASAAVSLQVVDSEIDELANTQRYTALAAMDIDGDGLPDVVSTGEARGVSDWRYARPTPDGVPNLDSRITRPSCGSCLPSPVDGLTSAVVAGRQWLVTFDPGQTLIELWSVRNGVLDSQDDTPLAANVQSVAIGDVNGDGLPDFAILLTSGAVSLIPGKPGVAPGKVDFDTANVVPLGTVAGTPLAVRLADVAGSALPDVIVLTGGASPSARVATATGSSPITFSAFASGAVPANPRDLEVADFDGDGRRDLLIGTDSGVSLARNETGTGGPVVGVTSTRTVNTIADVAVADVDGDGTPEVVAAPLSTLSIALLDVVGTTLSPPQTFLTVNGFDDLIAADLDGDGADEVVVAGRGLDVLANVSPGSAAATPPSAALGSVEVGRTGAPVAIAVTNNREGTDQVRSVHVEGAAAFDVFVTDGCSGAGVLAPGGQCTLTARLSPSATGTRAAQVRVDLAHAPDVVVSVSGEGTAATAGPQGPAGVPGPTGSTGQPGPAGPAGSTVRAAVLTTTKCARTSRTKVRCTLRLGTRTDLAGRVRLLVGSRTVGRATLAARATKATVRGKVPAARRRVVVALAVPGLASQRVTVAVPRGR